jgi:AcrR family transcriptional regulator
MGITERREREKEEVRHKILDAARQLFAEEGYEKVTMRRVADAIEYSPTTIYHYFEDKDDVVRALCHADFGRLLEAMETVARPKDPVEEIRMLGRAYCAFARESPNQYRFMFMTPVGKEEKLEDGNPGDLSFGHLLDAVERAIAAGRFRPIDPVTAAQVLWMGVHGVASALIALPAPHWPHGPAAPDLVDQVIDNTLRGLAAEKG